MTLKKQKYLKIYKDLNVYYKNSTIFNIRLCSSFSRLRYLAIKRANEGGNGRISIAQTTVIWKGFGLCC
jgi:hypothetical protein